MTPQPSNPRISVFITSYNQAAFLPEAIESVIGQSLRPHEIIVVDDASRDGSQDIISTYTSRFPGWIKPIFHSVNTGVSRARIDALQAVTGDYVTYVDGDDRFLPAKLEKEYGALRSRPGATIAFSNTSYMTVDGQRTEVWIEGNPPPEGMVFMHTFGRLYPKMSLYRMELVDYRAWKQVGFHDPNLTIYEDFDMRIRMTKIMATVYCDEILSEIRDHGQGLSSSKRALHHQSLDYIYQKNRPLLLDLSPSERKAAEAGFRLWAKKVGKRAFAPPSERPALPPPATAPRPAKPSYRGENLIFLLSQPRAGSTLLQRLIGGHPEVHTTAEPWIMLHPLFALKTSGVETDYRAALARQGLEDFLGQLPEGEAVYIESLRAQAEVLYGRALECSGKPRFLDKTPRYYHVIPELVRVFPEARFIFLFRNPIAVLASILKTWLRKDVHRLDPFLQHDLYTAPQRLLEGVDLLKEQAVVVNYEHLVAEPEEVLRRLCIRLDLPFTADLLDYGRKPAPAGRFGDPLNVHRHRSPVKAYADGWERGLTSPEAIALALDYLQRIGPERLARMGYVFEELQGKLEQIQRTQQIGGKAVARSEQLVRQGEALAERGEVVRAQALFEQALQLHPAHAGAQNNRGVLYYRQGDYPKAAECYRRAIALRPADPTYKKNLADLYCFATGQLEEAVALYREILAESPEDIEARLGLAAVCARRGHADDARFFCDQVRQLDPDNRDALQMLELLDRSAAAAGSEPAAEGGPAAGAEACDRRPEVLRSHLAALHRNPDDVDTLLAIAEICLGLGKAEDTLDFTLKALKLTPAHTAAVALTQTALATMVRQFSASPGAAAPLPPDAGKGEVLVSAIVSVYRAERFLRGCLEDLEAQTIADRLEIIVVDSASPEGERAIVAEFQSRFPNIRYIRTEERETVYGAWNRAIRAARGKYVTNANADDRHMPTAFAEMAAALEAHPEVVLVYADCIVTDVENETLAACTPAGAYRWLDWDRKRLLWDGCYMGPQPMWRRSVHEEYGYFDETLVTSGDYEFWLRISQTNDFLHLPRVMGLYLRSPRSVEHANQERKEMENRQILELYRAAHQDHAIVRALKPRPPARLSPPDPAVLDHADRLYQEDDLAGAFRTLQQALEHASPPWPVYRRLIDAVLAAGDAERAAELLAGLPPAADGSPALRAQIGHLHELRGDLDQAAQTARDVLALDPQNPAGLNLAGVVAFRRDQREAASDFFRRAAQLDPAWGEPWTNLGTLDWESGRSEEALEALENGFRLSPTAPHVAAAYHAALRSLGQPSRGVARFQEAVGRFPRFRKARYFLIDLLIQLADYHAALAAIETLILDFGADGDMLAVARQLRAKVGPLQVSSPRPDSISLCMIVRNEESNLPRCLARLKPLVDEMVIVDTGSTDHTRAIAEVFGARVWDYPWDNDFAAARNTGLEQARGRWILVLDADEVIAPDDHPRLKKLLRQQPPGPVAFSVVTRNYTPLCNLIDWVANDDRYPSERAGTGWTPSEKIRIFRNHPQVRFDYPVHEVVRPSLERLRARIRPCAVPVHHYGHLDQARARRKGEVYYRIGIQKLDQMGDDPQALRELAAQAALLGHHEKAAELWGRLLTRMPHDARALVNLSSVCAQLGRYEDARQHARQATLADPRLKEGHFNLALAELHCGAAEQACAILEPAVRRHADYYAAMFVLGCAWICRDRLDVGRQRLAALKSTPLWPTIHLSLQELAQRLETAGQTVFAARLRGAGQGLSGSAVPGRDKEDSLPRLCPAEI